MQRRFSSCILRTSVSLPSLPCGRFDDARELIEIDWTDCPTPDTQWSHHWRDGQEVVLSLARQGSDYWLRVPDRADFLLQLEPCRVLVSREGSSLDVATLEHLLLDQVLPRLLAQQGKLVIHASALAVAARAVLFLGPSGWGKSTLAGLLQRRGHTVLSDDCVQLNLHGRRFNAIPTYPSLRLYPDSLDAVFPDLTESTPVADYSEKRRVPVAPASGAGSGVPVDALYLLGDPAEADSTIRITPLRPAEICMALIKHSFRLDLSDRAASAKQLERCSEIARNVPAFRLDYPRDYATHDDLARALAQHLATLSATC